MRFPVWGQWDDQETWPRHRPTVLLGIRAICEEKYHPGKHPSTVASRSSLPRPKVENVDEIEFESILAGAQSGANWAWERIYTEFAGRIRGYVRRHGSSDPDDLVGEVFLQLARNIGTFSGTAANFRSWVFTVAHHRVLDDRRRRRRRPADPVAETPEPGPPVPDATAAAAIEADATDRVQVLLDQLVPAQREVLLLRIIGGLTVSEIAAAIGKNVGAVKALQRRGLAALQRIVDREGVSQ